MMNVLACLAGNPHCVLQVVDCSSHCPKGEKRDAFYVCQQMLPWMREIDPERKHVTSLLLMEMLMSRKLVC
jgi:hypothetical protein